MNNYIEYMDNISVDAALHEKIMKKAEQKPTFLRRNRVIFRFAGIAASAAILIFCIFTIPGLFNNPGNPIINTIPFDPDDTSILGLPVDNFGLDGLHIEVMMDRFGFSKMSDFFLYGNTRIFAFVRVIETKEWKDKNDSMFKDKQTSTVQIISTIWNRDDNIPQTIKVEQSKFGGCHANEPTNLLRVGGVYLLPLGYWDDIDRWDVWSDLDVLFEVDDKGRIWSHSKFEDFNRFDGQNASVVANAIIALTSDENFPAAITDFGRIAREWGILADITIFFDYDKHEYILGINDILSVSSNDEWYTWRPKSGDMIKKWHLNGSNEFIEIGGRYLMMLDPSDGGPYVRPERVTRINSDGTISPVSENKNNMFAEYNGYTVEQMVEETRRAKEWHEMYAK